MSLTIHTYERRWLEGMVEVYNRETAEERYIAPLTAELFLQLVEPKSYFDPKGLFVAEEGGVVLGWIHACVAAGSESWQNVQQKDARIRMLLFSRRRLDVGQELVRQATAWLKQSGREKALAIDASRGYPFYRGLWCGGEPMLPVTLPHVQAVLEIGGYKTNQQSILLTAQIDSPPQVPATAPDVAVEYREEMTPMAHEPMRESWVGFEPRSINATIQGQYAGSIGYVLIPHTQARLGSSCVNIWGLGVDERFRRKGIGGALIGRVLEAGYRLGARHATVGTQLWNAGAQLTYAKLGYEPACVMVGRECSLVEPAPNP
ncbi:MAG: GNAT family N-acetyltransferase [Phycisphaeraceae bacterium]|nr:GNAT family N-acetyltransferase [Phycisphaeraceae bacterium]